MKIGFYLCLVSIGIETRLRYRRFSGRRGFKKRRDSTSDGDVRLGDAAQIEAAGPGDQELHGDERASVRTEGLAFGQGRIAEHDGEDLGLWHSRRPTSFTSSPAGGSRRLGAEDHHRELRDVVSNTEDAERTNVVDSEVLRKVTQADHAALYPLLHHGEDRISLTSGNRHADSLTLAQ